MKKRCIALCLIACMLPLGLASASQTDTQAVSDATPEIIAAEVFPSPIPEDVAMPFPSPGPDSEVEEEALALLDEVFRTDSDAERIALLRQAAEAAPDNPNIQVSCAQLMFRADKNDQYGAECEAMLRRALTMVRDEEEEVYALQALTEQLTYWERLDEAETLLADAMARYPNSDDIQIMLATVYYYENREDDALALLEEMLEDSPKNLEGRRLYAAILQDGFRWEEALAVYQQISLDWPEYLDGMLGEYMVYAGMGEFEQAVRLIDQLLHNGASESLWQERARIRLWRQYQPEQAITEAEALLRANPEDIEAATVKLVGLLMLQRYEEAYAVTETLRSLDADYGDLMRSSVAMNAGDFQLAEEVLLALLEHSPGYVSAWKNLAAVRLEGYDDAQGALDALAEAFAIAGEKEDRSLYVQLGDVYLCMNQMLEAARAYSAADRATYEDPNPLYCVMSTCLDAGRLEDARGTVNEMERRYPGWYETMLARTAMSDADHDPQQALDVFLAMKEKFPYPTGRLKVYQGFLMAEAGDAEGAALIEEAMQEETDPERQARARDAYAYALLKQGEIEATELALDEALEVLERMPLDNPATMRKLRLSLQLTLAELRLAQGELEESADAFAKAHEYGWPSYIIDVGEEYAPIRETEAYQAMVKERPALEEEWDLSVLPTIPQK